MAWEIEATDEFADWYAGLTDEDADAVTTAVEALAEHGPALKRPLIGAIEGSRLRNLKELRAGSLRVLFAFDPRQAAILLLGADKAEEGWKAAGGSGGRAAVRGPPGRAEARGVAAMSRKWEDVRRDTGPKGEGRRKAMRQAMDDAMALGELRRARGLSQRDIAAQLSVSQARVSTVEREKDIYLSTLRRYVEAMGGRLELNAVFDDDRVELKAG
jgi:predicted XRE-type DNA-binding protein